MRSQGSKASLAAVVCGLSLLGGGCVPVLENPAREADSTTPTSYGVDGAEETGPKAADNSGKLKAAEFFSDPALAGLIDAAVKRNQELNIASLELIVARSEVMAREGEYLPHVDLRAGGGVDRPGENLTIDEELEDDAGEYVVGLFASWEIDIWKKLRNARTAAAKRYLASIEGKHFLVTNVVAEVAGSYYELMALDNQLDILRQNIQIQQQALDVVRLQKQAGKVSELAVKRFEAEVLKNRSRQFGIQQEIIETENRINLLAGRFRQPVMRASQDFMAREPEVVHAGLPAELLGNRPDVMRAELEIQAAKLDVEVAKARFYPSLELNAGVALREAFTLADFPTSPWSLAYKVAAELVQPIWNRKGLKAGYFAANSKQMQAVFEYERTILNAYTEVANQLAMVVNLQKSYDLRQQEVQRLTESIEISANLFSSARADYMEVLLTRRDALDAQMELIETKGKQMKAMVKLYRALGGGWK
ncbi:MAG: TolC family protein [Planctomycetota bacterium]